MANVPGPAAAAARRTPRPWFPLPAPTYRLVNTTSSARPYESPPADITNNGQGRPEDTLKKRRATVSTDPGTVPVSRPTGLRLHRWDDRAVVGVAVAAFPSRFGHFGAVAALAHVPRRFGHRS